MVVPDGRGEILLLNYQKFPCCCLLEGGYKTETINWEDLNLIKVAAIGCGNPLLVSYKTETINWEAPGMH